MSRSNGRRPSPAITLERAERDLVSAVLDHAGVELPLWLRFAVIVDQGHTSVSTTGLGAAAEHRLAAIAPDTRLELADRLRAFADAIEPGDLVGEPYRCPSCGKRELVPPAELVRAGAGARVCEGRLRRHAPAFLLPDHVHRAPHELG